MYVLTTEAELSLVPSVGWEVTTGQRAVALCGWGGGK